MDGDSSGTEIAQSESKSANDGASGVIVRSAVPDSLPYGDYKKFLRKDFVYSCAYCTMSEAEAQAIRFTIDHYEPQASRPDLKDAYDNLMYCCDECNTRKGDRDPPAIARDAGFRFFRPDNDNFSDHFAVSGMRISPKSPTGDYSIEALDLNRFSLRKLREIRTRVTQCDAMVAEGVRALRSFSVDQLPKSVRGSALTSIRKAGRVSEALVGEIESILEAHAASPVIDDEPLDEKEVARRRSKLAHLQNLYPGQWRGRQSRTKGG